MNEVTLELLRKWVRNPLANWGKITQAVSALHDAALAASGGWRYEKDPRRSEALERDLVLNTRRAVLGLLREVSLQRQGDRRRPFSLQQFVKLHRELKEECRRAAERAYRKGLDKMINVSSLCRPDELGPDEFENCKLLRAAGFRPSRSMPLSYSQCLAYADSLVAWSRHYDQPLTACMTIKALRPDYLRSIIYGPGSRAWKLKTLNWVLDEVGLPGLRGTPEDDQGVAVLVARDKFRAELRKLRRLRSKRSRIRSKAT